MLLKKYWSSYQALLKPLTTEGVPDLVIFRPPAFLLVQVLKKFPVTPNQVSFSAMSTGLACAFCFSLGTRRSFLWAGLFYGITVVLDCADGMLARLKNSGTLLGPIIDGFIDYANGFAIMLGFGIGVSRMNPDLPLNPWLLTALGGASMAVHCLLVDHFRSQFSIHALGKEEPIFRRTEQLKLLLARDRELGAPLGRRFLLNLSLFYHRIQVWFISKERRFDARKYYRRHKYTLRAWTMIELTMHILALIVSAFLFNPKIFYIYSIVIANIWMLLLAPVQYLISRKMEVRNHDGRIEGFPPDREKE